MRKRYLVANWKMNVPPVGVEGYLRTLAQLDWGSADLVIAPPFPFLSQLISIIEELNLRGSVAAQNCSDRDSGAFTGEVSAGMIRDLGVRYVIVGHSERRTIYEETDEIVGRKLRAVAAAELTPILCIGEDETTRKRGGTNDLLGQQLEVALDHFPITRRLVLAYEPVWAIGTGQNAPPEIAAEAHEFIRRRLAGLGFPADASILYGGSVAPENAKELAAQDQVDGFLVGGASLDPLKFQGIYKGFLETEGKAKRGVARGD